MKLLIELILFSVFIVAMLGFVAVLGMVAP